MDELNIHDELDSYARLSGKSKEIVGRRLLKAGTEMAKRIESLDGWLARGDDILREEPNEAREDKWIAKLHEYERLCDMKAAIEGSVLRA